MIKSLLLGSWKEVLWLALSVKVCSSGVPRVSKYRIKKTNCVGEEAATAELSSISSKGLVMFPGMNMIPSWNSGTGQERT